MTLVAALGTVVGRRHVLVGDARTRRFRLGIRYGGGDVLAVVRPGTLVEMWRVLQLCHAAGTVILCQAANTGLTGGSTPIPEGYGRPAVLINTLRLSRLLLLKGGEQVLCQPGVTLDQLERRLEPLNREPHSVIGSTCIGASVVGGVCNNSGGALIRRGPAFTELALFARIDAANRLELVNHLGIAAESDPEALLARLDAGTIDPATVIDPPGARASDRDYARHVRDVTAPTPARFNADPRRLHEASGSAGRIAVFAVRLDTFVRDARTRVFYVGSNRPDDLAALRRDILSRFESLPVAGEYMHRSAYALSRRYGRDLFLFIRAFGPRRVPQAFALKTRFDALAERLKLGPCLGDRLLQRLADRLPDHLPTRLNRFHDRFEHHLMLRMADSGIDEARDYLRARFPDGGETAVLECDAREGAAAFLHRFAVGNAVNRYRAVHRDTVEDIVALDVALPRNARDWFHDLPPALAARVVQVMYCGHFFCHVLHLEYLVRKGEDCAAVKRALLAALDARGARYPAEHNVGHLYAADDTLRDFYRGLDPTNSFNPGIGRTPTRFCWDAGAGTAAGTAAAPVPLPAG